MRNVYAEQLNAVDADLLTMTRLVQQAMTQASYALLTPDAAIAGTVLAQDACIDALRERIEDRVFELLALQQPVAGDLRMLVAAVRMVAELERMGDHAVHIAKVARLRVPAAVVPEELQPVVRRMADVAIDMAGRLTTVIGDRDVEAALQLEQDDEEMDELRRHSFRIMLAKSWPHGVEPAVDIALVGRYYERFADHAVGLGRRVVYLVTGELHPAR